MNRYKVLAQLGDGTYGSVWKAVNRETNAVVAIKKMKRRFGSWEECMALREVRSLRKLSHPAIVKLKEVVRERDELFFVFEYMECNLYQLMKARGRYMGEGQVRAWAAQILRGLAHIHAHGYFHRDLKPENLLVHNEAVKIADFGLARETHLRQPFTDYVSTRWYRAPEVLLRSPEYGPPVDLFAMGAIIAEMFSLRPLFPGSSEADQLYRICCCMGSPSEETWPEGLRLAAAMRFSLLSCSPIPLDKLVPQAPPAALDLIAALCQWDPARRPTAAEALQHPFFQVPVPASVPEPAAAAEQRKPQPHAPARPQIMHITAEAGAVARGGNGTIRCSDTIAAHYPAAPAATTAAAGAAPACSVRDPPAQLLQTPHSSIFASSPRQGPEPQHGKAASVDASPLQLAANSLGRRARRSEQQQTPRSIRSASEGSPPALKSGGPSSHQKQPGRAGSFSVNGGVLPAKQQHPPAHAGASPAHARASQQQLSPGKLALLQGLSRGFSSVLGCGSHASRSPMQDSARGSGGGMRPAVRRAGPQGGEAFTTPRGGGGGSGNGIGYAHNSAAKAHVVGAGAGRHLTYAQAPHLTYAQAPNKQKSLSPTAQARLERPHPLLLKQAGTPLAAAPPCAPAQPVFPQQLCETSPGGILPPPQLQQLQQWPSLGRRGAARSGAALVATAYPLPMMAAQPLGVPAALPALPVSK